MIYFLARFYMLSFYNHTWVDQFQGLQAIKSRRIRRQHIVSLIYIPWITAYLISTVFNFLVVTHFPTSPSLPWTFATHTCPRWLLMLYVPAGGKVWNFWSTLSWFNQYKSIFSLRRFTNDRCTLVGSSPCTFFLLKEGLGPEENTMYC